MKFLLGVWLLGLAFLSCGCLTTPGSRRLTPPSGGGGGGGQPPRQNVGQQQPQTSFGDAPRGSTCRSCNLPPRTPSERSPFIERDGCPDCQNQNTDSRSSFDNSPPERAPVPSHFTRKGTDPVASLPTNSSPAIKAATVPPPPARPGLAPQPKRVFVVKYCEKCFGKSLIPSLRDYVKASKKLANAQVTWVATDTKGELDILLDGGSILALENTETKPEELVRRMESRMDATTTAGKSEPRTTINPPPVISHGCCSDKNCKGCSKPTPFAPVGDYQLNFTAPGN